MSKINESFSDKYDFAYHYLKHVKTDKSMHSYEDTRFKFVSPQQYEKNAQWLADALVAPSDVVDAPIVGYINKKGLAFKYDRRYDSAVVYDLATGEIFSFYQMTDDKYESKKERQYQCELPETEILPKYRIPDPEAPPLEEAFEIHETLNKDLFDDNDLLYDDVREQLILIADYFVDSVKENGVPLCVVDYHLIGSNAAYIYTDESDIDIHIIVDFEKTNKDADLLQVLYDYAKSSFNKKYDIRVCGRQVELYLEDKNNPAKSVGRYSITKNEWVKKPEKQQPKTYDIENSELFKQWEEKYNNLQETDIVAFIDQLYALRQHNLRKDGEFSEGNLVFKEFRNRGYLEALKDRLVQLVNKQLSNS